MIEEAAFQALCEEVVIKMPHYTFSISETDELNDFISRNFPQKLWKIVESDQFKSIWWDESGTSIVINEVVFKKEVLERKAPFRIFETNSMKSLVRQLNLYGFRKKQQTFQRSASLADFLEEANNASVLSKSQPSLHPQTASPHLVLSVNQEPGRLGTDPHPSHQMHTAPAQRDHTLPSGNVTIRSPDSPRGHRRSKGSEDHGPL
ncbi:unnamed protein product [Rangifer tarandus platyrhynchus]|uniref:Uncharacterized protein n=1 Tax=Rangifer tarandus platyrhynchus TaxID=3082113 RepID=A0ACB1KF67_RANTA